MTTKSDTDNTSQQVIITLTLPGPDHEGMLLIQRGDLAHLRQFDYTAEMDFTPLIQQALAALAGVESNPPVIPDDPPRKTTVAVAPPPSPTNPPEPMIQVPTKTKKGTTTIPACCLKILGGETDEAAQKQAAKIAGRLLDSGLWDGKKPIGINDVYAVQLSLDGLTDKELKMLFTLEQFVQVNSVSPSTEESSVTDDSLQDTEDNAPVPAEKHNPSDEQA